MMDFQKELERIVKDYPRPIAVSIHNRKEIIANVNGSTMYECGSSLKIATIYAAYDLLFKLNLLNLKTDAKHPAKNHFARFIDLYNLPKPHPAFEEITDLTQGTFRFSQKSIDSLIFLNHNKVHSRLQRNLGAYIDFCLRNAPRHNKLLRSKSLADELVLNWRYDRGPILWPGRKEAQKATTNSLAHLFHLLLADNRRTPGNLQMRQSVDMRSRHACRNHLSKGVKPLISYTKCGFVTGSIVSNVFAYKRDFRNWIVCVIAPNSYPIRSEYTDAIDDIQYKMVQFLDELLN